MSTRDLHARNSSDDVHVRIVSTSFPEWHTAMSGNPTYQKIACNGWRAYIPFEEYRRFYDAACAAPGYDKWAHAKPFYAA